MRRSSHHVGWAAWLVVTVGTLALVPVPSKGETCAYVANSSSDSLSVIDIASESPVADIQVDGVPRAVAFDPLGRFVYTIAAAGDKRFPLDYTVSIGGRLVQVNEEDGTATRLLMLDSATYAVVREIPVRPSAEGMLISPDGAVGYLTHSCRSDGCGDGVDIVDLAAGRLPRVVAVAASNGVSPPRPALARDGTQLYIPLRDEVIGTIAVLDTAAATVTDLITFRPELDFPDPIAVALGPGDLTAYVLLGAGDGTLPVLDLASHSLTDVLKVSGRTLAVAPDGSELYVAASGVLRIVDLTTQAISTVSLPDLRSPVALALVPAQNALLIADYGSETVSVVDTATQLLRTQVPVGAGPRDIAIGVVTGACRPPNYTPRPTVTPTATPTATATLVLSADCPPDLPCVRVGPASGRQGDTVPVEVRLFTAGRAISGVQTSLSFDEKVISLAPCTAGEGISLAFNESPPILRAIVLGQNLEAIPSGAILYTCTATIHAAAEPGSYPLHLTTAIASDAKGNRIGVVGTAAQITVLPAAPSTTSGQAPAASSSASGCQLARRALGPPGWLMTAAGLLLVWRRRAPTLEP